MKNARVVTFAAMIVLMFASLETVLAQSPAQGQPGANSPAPNEPDKAAKKQTKLHVVVTAGEDSKPVAAAQVNVTSKEEGVNFSKQAHTDNEGEVDLVVPRGKLLIQVIAAHWPSGGVTQTMQGDKETVAIKLAAQAAHNN